MGGPRAEAQMALRTSIRPQPNTLSGVAALSAVLFSAWITCGTVHSGCASRTSATAPPTRGVESEVPFAGPIVRLLLATAQYVETPCATTSGLMRPSAVLPRPENTAMELSEPTAPHERM